MKINDYDYLSLDKFMGMINKMFDDHKYSDNAKIEQFNIGYNNALREIRRKLYSPDEDEFGIMMTPYEIIMNALSADMKAVEEEEE